MNIAPIAAAALALGVVVETQWMLDRKNRMINADQDVIIALLKENICLAKDKSCHDEAIETEAAFAAWRSAQ